MGYNGTDNYLYNGRTVNHERSGLGVSHTADEKTVSSVSDHFTLRTTGSYGESTDGKDDLEARLSHESHG